MAGREVFASNATNAYRLSPNAYDAGHENLAHFWRETYPKLKPQLKRRYPRHEWR
jgi:hypothetical protein